MKEMTSAQKAQKLALVRGLTESAEKGRLAYNCALVNYRLSPSDETRSEMIRTHQAWVHTQELLHTFWEWHASQFR